MQSTSTLTDILRHVRKDKIGSDTLTILDQWLSGACHELGHTDDIDGVVLACQQVHDEMFGSTIVRPRIIQATMFERGPLHYLRMRCIAWILISAFEDPDMALADGARAVFEFMDESGCFPAETLEY